MENLYRFIYVGIAIHGGTTGSVFDTGVVPGRVPVPSSFSRQLLLV